MVIQIIRDNCPLYIEGRFDVVRVHHRQETPGFWQELQGFERAINNFNDAQPLDFVCHSTINYFNINKENRQSLFQREFSKSFTPSLLLLRGFSQELSFLSTNIGRMVRLFEPSFGFQDSRKKSCNLSLASYI